MSTGLSAFEQLVIQMEYAVPLLKDLQDELGEDVVMSALQRRLEKRIKAAAANGADRRVGDTAIEAGFAAFAEGDSLDYEVIVSDMDHVDVDVHQCQYTALMSRLDARDLGDVLICGEDHVATAYAGTTLTRTQTRMQGADFCDFRFTSHRAE